MAVVAIVMLPTIAVVCSTIILTETYSAAVVTAASGALFVDILGIVATTWKLVLQQGGNRDLSPVTTRVEPRRREVTHRGVEPSEDAP